MKVIEKQFFELISGGDCPQPDGIWVLPDIIEPYRCGAEDWVSWKIGQPGPYGSAPPLGGNPFGPPSA